MTEGNDLNIDKLIDDSISEIDEEKKTDYLKLEASESFLDIEIKQKLGKNSFSASYLIKHEDENRILKILKSSLYNSYEDFYKPLVAYQNVDTKNKYQIYDFGSHEEYYYVISTFVEGRSLRQVLENKKEHGELFRLKHAYGIIIQILQELSLIDGELAHTLITPSTVIIARDGSVSVVEFGIYQNLTPAKRFKVSSEIGFSDFIAPELTTSNKDSSLIVSDIYSIGILLYWLLTFETPQEYFEIPATKSEDMSKGLQLLLENCIHPNPDNRLKDIKSLQITLTSLISEKPVSKIKSFSDNLPKVPPKAPPTPAQFKKPPTFKPASIKDTKLNLPDKKVLNEFEKYQSKKGDVTIGELDEVERWFFVKEGVDYGPVSAKKIRELVELKELKTDTIIKTLTHPVKRGKVSELELFKNFIKDFELKQSEEDMIKKMASSKRKKFIVIGLVALLLIGVGIFIFIKSNPPKEIKYAHLDEKDDHSGEVEVIVQESGGLQSDIDKVNKEKEDSAKVKKRVKKKRYRKRKVKNKKTGKVENVMVEIDEEAEMNKAFNENNVENKDVASISFNGKSSAKKLDDDTIKAKISTIKGSVISCFEQEYSRTNDLPSSLKISYAIRKNGKIYNVTIQHPKYKKKKGKLNYCVVKAFRSISFEPFSGGTKIGTMPLEFEVE
jgi:serine/threonine protein kinase